MDRLIMKGYIVCVYENVGDPSALKDYAKKAREAVEKYGSDRGKTLKLSALLMTAFAAGALITYYTGIDNSIYSNMGWESSNQGFTM